MKIAQIEEKKGEKEERKIIERVVNLNNINPIPPISICFDCKNARADKCEWVSDLKKVWTKGVKVTLKTLYGTEEHVWRVIECPNFDKEPERKYFVTEEDLLWLAQEEYEEEEVDIAK